MSTTKIFQICQNVSSCLISLGTIVHCETFRVILVVTLKQECSDIDKIVVLRKHLVYLIYSGALELHHSEILNVSTSLVQRKM